MSLDSLAGMFSQRTGAQQSMSGSIMNAIIGYLMQNMMQKGLSSFLGGGGGSDAGGLKSALSSLGGGSKSGPCISATCTTKHWYSRSRSSHTIHTAWGKFIK